MRDKRLVTWWRGMLQPSLYFDGHACMRELHTCQLLGSNRYVIETVKGMSFSSSLHPRTCVVPVALVYSECCDECSLGAREHRSKAEATDLSRH
jgi:hypothetical protein